MDKNTRKLLYEIYDELDMIQTWASFSNCALKSDDSQELNKGQLIVIFKDIEKREKRIFELVEQLEHEICCLSKLSK